jgi:hypothetical protein
VECRIWRANAHASTRPGVPLPPRSCSRLAVERAYRAVSLPVRGPVTARCDSEVRLCRAKLRRLMGGRRDPELMRAASRLDVIPPVARIVASTFRLPKPFGSHPPHSSPPRSAGTETDPHRRRIADGSQTLSRRIAGGRTSTKYFRTVDHGNRVHQVAMSTSTGASSDGSHRPRVASIACCVPGVVSANDDFAPSFLSRVVWERDFRDPFKGSRTARRHTGVTWRRP